MKTKIVYVVASLDDDIYMEQAIVSAWSVRYYNPDCQIEMVCDQDTFKTLDSGIRSQNKSLFNKIHVREFKPEQGMMERSRWMKTTLREIIEGDFLYLDSDTVVCADLSYIDEFDFDLGMVRDGNCEFNKCLHYDWAVSSMKKIYDMDVSKEFFYFNSGVAFVRDSAVTRKFYRRWNENWAHSLQKFGIMKDQQPLMKTNMDMDYVITELSGNLNCIVTTSIKYLHTAHVVHFVNNVQGRCEHLSPFFKEIFLQIKQNGITKDIQEAILNCKTSFTSPSMPVTREAAVLWRNNQSDLLGKKIRTSNIYLLMYSLWFRLPRFMQVIDSFVGVLKKCVIGQLFHGHIAKRLKK